MIRTHQVRLYDMYIIIINVYQFCPDPPNQYETVLEIPDHNSTNSEASEPLYDDNATRKSKNLTKHSWYHSNITKEQAEAALRLSNDNGFLVRISTDSLVLSKSLWGWLSHDIIHHSPSGYRLDGKEEAFKSVPEMITHYQHHPIDGSKVLGTAITTVPSGEHTSFKPRFFPCSNNSVVVHKIPL